MPVKTFRPALCLGLTLISFACSDKTPEDSSAGPKDAFAAAFPDAAQFAVNVPGIDGTQASPTADATSAPSHDSALAALAVRAANEINFSVHTALYTFVEMRRASSVIASHDTSNNPVHTFAGGSKDGMFAYRVIVTRTSQTAATPSYTYAVSWKKDSQPDSSFVQVLTGMTSGGSGTFNLDLAALHSVDANSPATAGTVASNYTATPGAKGSAPVLHATFAFTNVTVTTPEGSKTIASESRSLFRFEDGGVAFTSSVQAVEPDHTTRQSVLTAEYDAGLHARLAAVFDGGGTLTECTTTTKSAAAKPQLSTNVDYSDWVKGTKETKVGEESACATDLHAPPQ
jgi:hypothetical protein